MKCFVPAAMMPTQYSRRRTKYSAILVNNRRKVLELEIVLKIFQANFLKFWKIRYICTDMPKYIFNKETLTYEEYAYSGKLKVLRAFLLFAASIAAAFLYLWFYTSVLGYDLPKTALLKKTNARLNTRLELLNRELDADADYLASFQSRDNDIYRSVFGMSEIPAEVRNAGFGGVDRYAYLDAIDRTGLLKQTEVKIDVLTKKAYLQSNSFDEIESVAKKAGDMAACIPSVPPIVPDRSQYRISSSFGYRSDPFLGTKKRHTGTDFACHIGNEVYSTADGVVETVRTDGYGYGKYVIINHGFGYKTRYAHLSQIKVEKGMKVSRGTLIALSGNSGRSSGPHLHYEVIYKDNYVNPMNYMDLAMSVGEYSQVTEKASVFSGNNPS